MLAIGPACAHVRACTWRSNPESVCRAQPEGSRCRLKLRAAITWSLEPLKLQVATVKIYNARRSSQPSLSLSPSPGLPQRPSPPPLRPPVPSLLHPASLFHCEELQQADAPCLSDPLAITPGKNCQRSPQQTPAPPAEEERKRSCRRGEAGGQAGP
ncbi:hypothetical protein DPEC_G00361700 [Dallia pectoralis]|nr:hypothetical protein DPEC_G00361700 [Dallia pectoralis]